MSGARWVLAFGATLLTAGCATVPPPAQAVGCLVSPDANRRLVVDFYTEALVQKHVRAGFEKYVRADFIEHKPDIADGNRENAILFLEGLIKQLPGAEWQVRRTVADGDLVALHASFRPAPGAPEYAIADFFRLESCRIVEHWDVVAPPPAKAPPNPKPRF